MIYPDRFEEKVGFPRIRELIRAHCLFEPGRERVDDLRMLTDHERLTVELDRVEEFRQMQLRDVEFPVTQFYDIRPALKKAAIEGTHLEVEEVFAIGKSMESVRAILKFFTSDEAEEYPRLRDLSSAVKVFPYITDRVANLLNRHGKIRDNASPELQQIRRSVTTKQSEVNKQLQRIMKKVQSQGWSDEDASATFRSGRPVIPVAATHKRKVGGMIHDESASGKTVFIEPPEVVELTNEIRELEYAERREIIRILRQFTDDIRPYLDELAAMHDYLAEIDFIRARALFALQIHAVRPGLENRPVLDWFDAFHPLLYLALQPAGREVVPLTLHLDGKSRILLISGPNAGGKSVCLQTVGLLQYMVQCGLLVPVRDQSKFGIFSGVFIDIGDEQSIDNDLSTYSSHLFNMKYFVRHAAADTLVLIDEFGTGTEPMLGGSIAEAILESLNQAGTYGVMTTHYTNLKHVATASEGIINGAMLFDNHRMQPLYQLQVGKPGSSFAFEIARKIGLPEEILERASGKVGQEHIDFDRHLKDILRDKKYWEGKRRKIRQSEKRLEELMARYEEELGKSDKQRREIMREAKEKADDLLAGANRQIENTIREIKEANAEKEQTRRAREKLEAFREQAEKEEEARQDRLQKEMRELKKQEEHLARKRPDIRKNIRERKKSSPKPAAGEAITEGDTVRMKGQHTPGEVLEVHGTKCVVAFGNLKTNTRLDQLEKVERGGSDGGSKGNRASVNLGDWDVAKRRVRFRPEIDLRGKRADEALQQVADYIDEAIMVSAPEVRILHGKGDGILRQLIRDYLQSSRLVQWFGDEHVERGGSGITIVRFTE